MASEARSEGSLRIISLRPVDLKSLDCKYSLVQNAILFFRLICLLNFGIFPKGEPVFNKVLFFLF